MASFADVSLSNGDDMAGVLLTADHVPTVTFKLLMSQLIILSNKWYARPMPEPNIYVDAFLLFSVIEFMKKCLWEKIDWGDY